MKNKIVLSSILSLLLTATTLLSANTQTIHHYSVSVVPKNMSVQEKKQRFYALLVPAVEKVYKELEKKYEDTKLLVQKDPNSKKVQALMQSYGAKTPQDLLVRMKPHPRSITLAQSAMESAWGTSRFLRIANNVFGVWSFNKNEPRVPAGKKRGNTTIYVKKYASIADSIKDYYRVLATGKAFKAFRAEKMKTNDPYVLVKYLDKYSERGADYGKELASMIRHNHLTQYDK
jgi:Bax protein